MKAPASDPLCASAFVTVTPTAPAACAGVVAVIVVAFTTVTPVALVPPTLTVAPALNPVPLIVIAVPPTVDPDGGATPVTVGAGAVTVRLNDVVCVTDPATAVTVTDVVPRATAALALSVRFVLHVGEHDGVSNEPVTPAGRPETLKVAAWLVPDDNVAVTMLDTAEPRTTDLFPLLLRVKSNGEPVDAATRSMPTMPQ